MSVPAAYLGVILIWSTTPLAIQWSSEAGYLFGVTARMAVGLALCGLLVPLLRADIPNHREAWRTYLIAGLGIYVSMLSTYWGARYIPSGLISVLFGLTPIVTGLMASLWLTERGLTPARLVGMGAGLAGLALVFRPGGHADPRALQGMGAVLLAVLAHSASTVGLRRYGGAVSALATTTGALAVALAAYLLTWVLAGEHWPEAVPTRAGGAILYLGVFGSALGFFLFFYVIRHAGASRAATIPLLTPVLALLVGALLNGERVSVEVLLGAALILSGLLFHEQGEALWRALRLLRRASH